MSLCKINNSEKKADTQKLLILIWIKWGIKYTEQSQKVIGICQKELNNSKHIGPLKKFAKQIVEVESKPTKPQESLDLECLKCFYTNLNKKFRKNHDKKVLNFRK